MEKITINTDKSISELSGKTTKKKPIRLLPGLIIVILQWIIWFVFPKIVPDNTGLMMSVFGGLLGGIAIVVWWAFFSRAPGFERWGAVVLMIFALAGTSFIIHKSIGTGMQGLMFAVYAVPVLSLAFVIWAILSRKFSMRLRRLTMVATILVACGFWTLMRSDGMASDTSIDLEWRWTETDEERLLSQSGEEKMKPFQSASAMDTTSWWPGFRGSRRDGIIHGVKISTDWSASPPSELWRKPIGPGCSSFAIKGNYIYTQEQRGEDEVVSCYTLANGEPVWRHTDKARFWDSHAGAGPRSTPTLFKGRVYTFGATGILNVLDATDGTVIWSRNAASDAGAKDSGWGFTSSPLVVNDVVIIAATGKILAYDNASGDLIWSGPDGGDSYSSPQLFKIDGIDQILLISATGATSVDPVDGKLLWDYNWPAGTRISQPAITGDGGLLVSAGEGKGIRRITAARRTGSWAVEEDWTSNGVRPNHYDCVLHKGYVYGFTGPNLACMDIKNGTQKWKGGRFGGFIVLLADQDLLLILSEKGELALIEANSEKYTELAIFQALEDKTWNHPAMAGNILLVRNSVEMVAFKLPYAME